MPDDYVVFSQGYLRGKADAMTGRCFLPPAHRTALEIVLASPIRLRELPNATEEYKQGYLRGLLDKLS